METTNEIFETGISQRARPLMRLNKQYNQYLERMMLIDTNTKTIKLGSTYHSWLEKKEDNPRSEGMTLPQYTHDKVCIIITCI